VNRDALYFLVDSADPSAPFVQFDIVFQTDSKMLQISWGPGQEQAFLGDVTSGWSPIGNIERSKFAFGPVLEGRVDLLDVGSPVSLNLLFVNVMAGDCCEYPAWRAVDRWRHFTSPGGIFRIFWKP
jgi:hypothetical protein